MYASKITIVARGETEEDLQDAIAEAVRRIRNGNTSGSDRGDAGGFYFTVSTDLLAGELPA